jgi:hypothetical protein
LTMLHFHNEIVLHWLWNSSDWGLMIIVSILSIWQIGSKGLGQTAWTSITTRFERIQERYNIKFWNWRISWRNSFWPCSLIFYPGVVGIVLLGTQLCFLIWDQFQAKKDEYGWFR